MGRDIFHYTRILKVPSILALNTSKDRASTASLGKSIAMWECAYVIFVHINNLCEAIFKAKKEVWSRQEQISDRYNKNKVGYGEK